LARGHDWSGHQRTLDQAVVRHIHDQDGPTRLIARAKDPT